VSGKAVLLAACSQLAGDGFRMLVETTRRNDGGRYGRALCSRRSEFVRGGLQGPDALGVRADLGGCVARPKAGRTLGRGDVESDVRVLQGIGDLVVE